jgi:hypothetical protein
MSETNEGKMHTHAIFDGHPAIADAACALKCVMKNTLQSKMKVVGKYLYKERGCTYNI